MVRTTSALGSLALLCSAVVGKEINLLGARFNEAYDSGAVHERIMKIKMSGWDAELEAGAMNSALYPELGYTKCVNGFAEAIKGDVNNTFKCRNTDLYHFLSHADTGSKIAGQASSSWGWTSADGREFVAIGQFDGTAFVEVSKEGKMIYLGRLESGDGIGARWREIRTVGDHIIVGSEAFDHGIQFFDMKKLLTLSPASPKTFTNADLATHWGRVSQGNPADAWDKLPVGRTHNVVVNEELKWAAAVGSVAGNITTRVRDFSKMPCNGGIIFLNTTDFNNVRATGCASADHYVHDAQCVVYRGPDARYQGRDICYGYNEDTITIFDVTNKIGNNTKIISRISYEGAEYIHQGFVLDLQNQEYLVMDDEYDEVEAPVGPASTNKLPTTHIFDIRDLEKPKYTGYFQGKTRNIDHNQYVIDGYTYQSNYGAGLTVWDIRSIPKDPSGKSVKEVAYFDIYPEDDEAPGGGKVAFLGSWSHYAYFKSGFIYINTIERGSFIVKITEKSPPKAPVCNADNCLRAFRANTIPGRLAESQAFCSSFLARKRDASAVTKTYALQSCTRTTDVAAQVSSACACLPTAVVPL